MREQVRTPGPDRIPYFPETGYRLVREGLKGSRLYELDGYYYVDARTAKGGKKRSQYTSLFEASQAFVALQERLGARV